jgi:hypothetical protein
LAAALSRGLMLQYFRIPGFFTVSAVYMVGEKAADVILAS